MMAGVAKATNMLGLILIAGGSLSACSNKSEDEPLAVNPGRESKGMESEFGEGFDKAFKADPNSEPRVVENNDVPPVSYTTEPVAID